MRYIRLISLLMVVLGFVLVVAGFVLRLDPLWALAGLLMLWAGIVKVVVAALWRKLGTSDAVQVANDSYR